MNDEIKEILEFLKVGIDKLCISKPDFSISYNDVKILLDYITNLQKENERLKQDYINLKNYIVLRKADSEVQDKAILYNIELENINKKRYEDYKSRIEKAVEILKDTNVDMPSTLLIETIDNVMNILNGRSDE